MRAWLTTRCVLVVLLLVVAPGAALGHLLAAWLPRRIELSRLQRELEHDTQQLRCQCEQNASLQKKEAQVRRIVADRTRSHANWLPRRDRDGVFDRLARAFRDPRVSIDQLTLGEPALYVAASAQSLLACERAQLVCTGPYPALADCLDRLATSGLPLRFRQLSWDREGELLRLALTLEVPFVPDEPLRAALADEAGLVGDDDGS